MQNFTGSDTTKNLISAGKMAEEAFRQKKYAEAIVICKNGLEESPNDFGFQKILVGSQMKLDQFGAADATLVGMDCARPNQPFTLTCLGLVRYELADYDNAVSFYYRALSLGPGTPSLFKGLAASLMKLNRLPEAIDALESALLLEPTWNRARFEIARARLSAGNIEGAIQAFREFIAVEPRQSSGYFALSQALVIKAYVNKDLRELGGAASALVRATSLSPLDRRMHLAGLRCLRAIVEIVLLKLKRPSYD